MMFYRYMNPDLIHILNFLLNYSQTSTNTTQKKHINTHSRNQFFEPNVSILTYQRKGCDWYVVTLFLQDFQRSSFPNPTWRKKKQASDRKRYSEADCESWEFWLLGIDADGHVFGTDMMVF